MKSEAASCHKITLAAIVWFGLSCLPASSVHAASVGVNAAGVTRVPLAGVSSVGIGFSKPSDAPSMLAALPVQPLGDGHSLVRTSEAPTPGSYNQARVIDLGTHLLVHTAGQTGNDPKAPEEALVAGGIEPQTRQALMNIGAIVSALGGNLSHIVKTTVFMTDLAHDNGGFEKVYRSFFDGHPLPARSKVGVSELPVPGEGSIVEIEAIAVIPKK